jgi:hypothetical protein
MPHTSSNLKGTSAKSKPATHQQDTGGGLDREGMISVAAYFHAEHRGFAGGGDALADWLAAEAEIDAMLNSSQGVKAH